MFYWEKHDDFNSELQFNATTQQLYSTIHVLNNSAEYSLKYFDLFVQKRFTKLLSEMRGWSGGFKTETTETETQSLSYIRSEVGVPFIYLFIYFYSVQITVHYVCAVDEKKHRKQYFKSAIWPKSLVLFRKNVPLSSSKETVRGVGFVQTRM